MLWPGRRVSGGLRNLIQAVEGIRGGVKNLGALCVGPEQAGTFKNLFLSVFSMWVISCRVVDNENRK